MIGEKVVIIVDEETKGLKGIIAKIDHKFDLYGIAITTKGFNNNIRWFLRSDFEVIE